MPLPRPPPVAIHDDGDVPRQPVRMNLLGERGLLAIRGNPRRQSIEAHGRSKPIVNKRGWRVTSPASFPTGLPALPADLPWWPTRPSSSATGHLAVAGPCP